LDRSDILDIGNKNIVLYRIEFMPAIHRPTGHHSKLAIFIGSSAQTGLEKFFINSL
jgi:hypothetical protein